LTGYFNRIKVYFNANKTSATLMSSSPSAKIRVIDSAADWPEIPILDGEGNAKVVMWPGNGAVVRSFHLISMKEGTSTTPLRHGSDCVYYIIEGAGAVVDLVTGKRSPLIEGSMIHIDAGDQYRLTATAGGLRVIGGPCPPDETLYSQINKPSE
jgi:mannose-6-phosphate isomerase-like protein (cupin superfamily)